MRTVYEIRNTACELVAEHVRVDWANGQKRMYWQRPGCDPRDGLNGLTTPDLPLYGSEHITSFDVGQTVVIGEGEKSTEALWSFGIDALGTVTGTSAIPCEDALSVLLPFDIILWPDHDRVGWLHMNRLAHAMVRLGGSLPRYVGPGATLADGTVLHGIVPRGFDAGDIVAGFPSAKLRRLIDAARPWDLHADPPKAPARVTTPAYKTPWDDDRVDRARSHLVEVVSARLGPHVKKDGRSLFWRCPFHNERTPSFKVDLREPFFRCFGCGERGDVFDFMQRMEGVEFKTALRELAPPRDLGGLPRIWT